MKINKVVLIAVLQIATTAASDFSNRNNNNIEIYQLNKNPTRLLSYHLQLVRNLMQRGKFEITQALAGKIRGRGPTRKIEIGKARLHLFNRHHRMPYNNWIMRSIRPCMADASNFIIFSCNYSCIFIESCNFFIKVSPTLERGLIDSASFFIHKPRCVSKTDYCVIALTHILLVDFSRRLQYYDLNHLCFIANFHLPL